MKATLIAAVLASAFLLTACGGSADPIADPDVTIGKPDCAASVSCL